MAGSPSGFPSPKMIPTVMRVPEPVPVLVLVLVLVPFQVLAMIQRPAAQRAALPELPVQFRSPAVLNYRSTAQTREPLPTSQVR
jgi:hypothetical protein